MTTRVQVATAGALTKDVVADGLEMQRVMLDGEPGDANNAFERLWPPDPLTFGVAPSVLGRGDVLGFLRYLTRNPANALQVDSPRGYSLTLDRMVTAPNAVIGVSFQQTTYKSKWVFLTPGDTIMVPGGFDRFYMWNADDLDAVGVGVAATPSGYCGFLVGTRRNGKPPTQTTARPRARVIGAAIGPLWFGLGRCSRLKVTLIPLDAGGAFCANTSWTGLFILNEYARCLSVPMTGAAFDKEAIDDNAPLTQVAFGSRSVWATAIPQPGNPSAAVTVIEARRGLFAQLSAVGATLWSGTAIASVLTQVESDE